MKWICESCKAINPSGGFKCHLCGAAPKQQSERDELGETAAKKYARELGNWPSALTMAGVNGHTRGWDEGWDAATKASEKELSLARQENSTLWALTDKQNEEIAALKDEIKQARWEAKSWRDEVDALNAENARLRSEAAEARAKAYEECAQVIRRDVSLDEGVEKITYGANRHTYAMFIEKAREIREKAARKGEGT